VGWAPWTTLAVILGAWFGLAALVAWGLSRWFRIMRDS